MQILPIYLYPNTLDVILDLDVNARGAYNIMYQRDLKVQKGIKNVIRIQFKNSDQKRISISNSGTYMFSMFDINSQRMVIEKPLQVVDDTVVLYQSINQPTASNQLYFANTTGLVTGQSVSGFGIRANTIINNISSGTVTLNYPTTAALTSATSLTFSTLAVKGVAELVLTESDTLDLDVSGYQFSVKYQDPSDSTFLPTYANTYYGVAGNLELAQDIYPVLQPSQTINSFLKRLKRLKHLMVVIVVKKCCPK
jgi:hypothetical protein